MPREDPAYVAAETVGDTESGDGASGTDYAAVFAALPGACLLLDPGWVICTANRAYLTATGRTHTQLQGHHIFEAFPDNPDDPDADGVANLRASLQQVMDTAAPHSMWVQRYDIPVPATPGAFTPRYWSPVNTPVLHAEGGVRWIIHQVEDVTAVREDLMAAVEFYRHELDTDHGNDTDRARRFTSYAAAALVSGRLFADVAAEAEQMRTALVSRAVIDQAKGILMGQRRCTADEAFALLTTISQDTNRKLRDVAAALVATAHPTANAKPPQNTGNDTVPPVGDTTLVDTDR